MKVVFIGNVHFSAKMLEALLEHVDVEIAGLVTLGRAGPNADFFDLRPYAQRLGCPLYLDEGDTPKLVEFLHACSPDVVFCLGWSRLLPASVLSIAPLGVVGYHPAALPENRGRHPIIWAIALGLERTASTFFLMNEGADSGPILSQQTVPITPVDDAGSLYAKLESTAAAQLHEVVRALRTGEPKLQYQDDAAANYWRKRSRVDGLIDWRMSAVSIHNLVRALAAPYPGAEFMLDNMYFVIRKTRVETSNVPNNAEPGKVLAKEGVRLLIKCGDDAIWLLEHSAKSVPEPGGYL